ncbi:hypothetical protein APY04_0093 [Hyphomicrobium sulfonivorans]|uniref:Uncharacterized protein n=1 Tax=Hyphomicrobium sulfonivorans TaxID=121290 RepID=A0A109BPF6_HYPSL|nr:hypothetical protein APY04_0093 [Hyphomicrobium sulfonivorans]
MKNRILLENYYPPGDLERSVRRIVEHYNHACYHVGNITDAAVEGTKAIPDSEEPAVGHRLRHGTIRLRL